MTENYRGQSRQAHHSFGSFWPIRVDLVSPTVKFVLVYVPLSATFSIYCMHCHWGVSRPLTYSWHIIWAGWVIYRQFMETDLNKSVLVCTVHANYFWRMYSILILGSIKVMQSNWTKQILKTRYYFFRWHHKKLQVHTKNTGHFSEQFFFFYNNI